MLMGTKRRVQCWTSRAGAVYLDKLGPAAIDSKGVERSPIQRHAVSETDSKVQLVWYLY